MRIGTLVLRVEGKTEDGWEPARITVPPSGDDLTDFPVSYQTADIYSRFRDEQELLRDINAELQAVFNSEDKSGFVNRCHYRLESFDEVRLEKVASSEYDRLYEMCMRLPEDGPEVLGSEQE